MELMCARSGCTKMAGNRSGKSKYCSDSCRAAASRDRLFVKRDAPIREFVNSSVAKIMSGELEWKLPSQNSIVRIKPAYDDGPLCWCGKPAKFKDGEYPKCGNHALGHRSEKERWRKLMKELQGLGYERARETVRMANAQKAVEELDPASA